MNVILGAYGQYIDDLTMSERNFALGDCLFGKWTGTKQVYHRPDGGIFHFLVIRSSSGQHGKDS